MAGGGLAGAGTSFASAPIYPGLTGPEQLTQAYTDSRGEGALMLQALSQLAVAEAIGASRSLRRNLDKLNMTGGE